MSTLTRTATLLSTIFLLFSGTAFGQNPPLTIKDEGTAQGLPVFELDCVGAGVACTHSGITGTITVAGGGGSGDVTDVGDCSTGACFTADGTGNAIVFEGSTADTFETTLTCADPGADYTITLPASSGTVELEGHTHTESDISDLTHTTDTTCSSAACTVDSDDTVNEINPSGDLTANLGSANAWWWIFGGDSGLRFLRNAANDYLFQMFAGDLTIDANTGRLTLSGGGTTGDGVWIASNNSIPLKISNQARSSTYWSFTSQGISYNGDRYILNETSDASDTGDWRGYAGGGTGVNRGARWGYYGNEHATNPGLVEFAAGNVTGGEIRLRTGNDVLQWWVDETGDLMDGAGNSIIFEGATADDYEGTLSSADVTSDVTWTLPDSTGTIALTSDIPTDTSTLDVNQSTHGFAAEDVIYRTTGGAWAKAQSNASSTLGVGVVTAVADTDNFTVQFSGLATINSHGLTVGNYYFVDGSTAGLLTSTEPTSGYSNPIVLVVDANTLLILPWRPSDLTDPLASIDTEAELESHLTDVSNVIVSTEIDTVAELDAIITDGALDDDDITDDVITSLSDVTGAATWSPSFGCSCSGTCTWSPTTQIARWWQFEELVCFETEIEGSASPVNVSGCPSNVDYVTFTLPTTFQSWAGTVGHNFHNSMSVSGTTTHTRVVVFDNSDVARVYGSAASQQLSTGSTYNINVSGCYENN